MRRPRSPKPHKRDGVWYLIRRVPKEFAHLDKRKIVRITTEIAVADDPRAARAGDVVTQLAKELDAYWRGMRDGQSAEARIRFDAAQNRARALGITYRTAAELAAPATDASDILKRVQLLLDRNALEDESEVAAVLGGEDKPRLRLSDLVKTYEEIQQTDLRQMSPKQLHKWRLPKTRAVANLTEVLGEDKEMAALTRDDAVKFRFWWEARLAAEGLDIGTANKDIGHINKMLTAVDLMMQLGLKPVFGRLRIAGETDKQRAAFDPAFVQDSIFATGALDGLNEEARHLIYLVAESGLRPSEAANLLPETIHVTHKVPHVQVRAIGRKVKTSDSLRDVPLVGAALEVMTLHPNGFPRYRDNEDSLSALVNDYLELHGLLPTDDHSLYSLRHTFEDRLTAVEAPEKVIATLMGHKWHRPKYGAGPTLEQKLRWLKRIAFRPPEHF